MRVLSFLLLTVLIIIALLYTAIGLKFSFVKRRSRYLIFSFILGLVIGIIGGFAFLYNLKISKDAAFFNIDLERWLTVTFFAVLLGGLLSLFIYLKMRRK